MPIQHEFAETQALNALAWLAENDDIFTAFLQTTGVSQADFAMRAADPEFLASVVDFILTQDRWVLAWAKSTGVPPETLANIRAHLPGGSLPHWT